MLFAIDTWSAACSWVCARTSCSMVRSSSARRCSIQVSGSASAAPWPCRRRASSATKELVIGGFERAMSAVARIRLFASRPAISIMRSAQVSARLRSAVLAAMRAATRRRFSISARRSMMGTAQSSPRPSGATL